MDPIYEETTADGYTIMITFDSDPVPPLSDVHLVRFTQRYSVGEYMHPDDWKTFCRETPVVSVPVFYRDHSALRLSCSMFFDRWDSGLFGAAYLTRDQILSIWGGARLTAAKRAMAEQMIRDTITELDDYINGYVLCWTVISPYGETETTGGYYGHDLDDALEDAYALINNMRRHDEFNTPFGGG